MKVSVILLTYNGQQFILEMITSIIKQSRSVDELIVSDDGSCDNTVQIIKEFAVKHPNLNLILLENKKNIGINKNLSKAIKYATGSLLLLADQDDIWDEFKVEYFLEVYLKGKHYIISEMDVIDEHGFLFPFTWTEYCLSFTGSSHFIISNGCATGMSEQFIKTCLPIPPGKAHDVWFGYCAVGLGERYYIDKPLMRYRFNPEGSSSKIHSKEIKSGKILSKDGLIPRNYSQRINFTKNFYQFKYYKYLFTRILMLLFFIRVKILWSAFLVKKSSRVSHYE